MPSKFAIGSEIAPVPFFVCTTGSFASDVVAFGCRFSSSRAVTDVMGTVGRTGRSLTAGEVPLKAPPPVCGPKDGAAVVELAVEPVLALLLARAMPARAAWACACEPPPLKRATPTSSATSDKTMKIRPLTLVSRAAERSHSRGISHPRDPVLALTRGLISERPINQTPLID